MRVLVIEDDDSLRAAVRRALLLGGYEVLAAQTGQEGLLKAEADVPDAIVLDLGLPDIDGMEVCRRLRRVGNRTPILMLTARDAVEDRVEGLEAGADDYLIKPYDVAASFNQTLDALERSIQAQRHLIADASHELRTPMAALRSNIQIFLEAHRLPVEERQGLQHAIIAELAELTQLVADVVELARGSAPSEHTEPIELNQIVREAVARAQRRSPQLHVRLDLEPTVIINAPDRVSRSIANVIDNARKWSPPDGQIDVRLRDGVLCVRDHGPGFNKRDLQHVFDRFYRAEAARRRPGSGLGLAIVKQAAEAHGGFAQAANAPDGGAILRISFGSSAGPSERTQPEAATAPAPR